MSTCRDIQYEVLKENSKSKKFILSLERIKEACDFYVKEKLPIRLTSIASYVLRKYGGPAEQSIRNNVKLCQYIKARSIVYSHPKEHNRSILDFTHDERIIGYVNLLEIEKNDLLRQLNDCKALLKTLNPIDIDRLIVQQKNKDLINIQDIVKENEAINFQEKYENLMKKLLDKEHLSRFFLVLLEDKKVIISENTHSVFLNF